MSDNNKELRLQIAKFQALNGEVSERLCEAIDDGPDMMETQDDMSPEEIQEELKHWGRSMELCYLAKLDDDRTYWRVAPDWTENLNDAWELLDEMVKADDIIITCTDGCYLIAWGFMQDTRAMADTLELAICYAYIVWMEERMKDD